MIDRDTLRRPWVPVAVAAAAAMGVAILGGAATDVGPWYHGLAKGRLNPPDWVFPPAWTLIYALCALSGAIAWRHARTTNQRRLILVLFAIDALLNILWSELFFTMRRPDLAFVEIAPFWLSVLALVIYLRPISERASWLLAPYLLWVIFAGYLNWAVVALNGPFTNAT